MFLYCVHVLCFVLLGGVKSWVVSRYQRVSTVILTIPEGIVVVAFVFDIHFVVLFLLFDVILDPI